MFKVDSIYYHLSIYKMALRLQLAVWTQYRIDYIAGIFYVLIEQAVMLALFGVIFTNIPNLVGWSAYEVLTIYGFTRVAMGITDSFTENLWLVPGYAQDGSLTDYLVRPVNVLFQLLSEHLHFERLVSCIIGFVFIVYGSYMAGFVWNFNSLLIAAYFVLLGTIIYGSIMLLGASLTIFFIGAASAMQALWSLTEFAKYPTSIFGRVGSILLLTILPIGVIGFVPSSILFKPEPLSVFQTLLTSTSFTFLLSALCYITWLSALRSYNGTGT